MTQSNETKNLLAALVEVQSELPTMPKDSQAYGYKYADLDLITQTIKPILKKHKIGYMQSVGSDANGSHILTTRIFDANGEYIEDTAALPVISGVKNNAAQVLGMAITYMRRYALCAMLGITSDEDTDANPQGRNAPQGNPSQNNAPKSNAKASNLSAVQAEKMKQMFATDIFAKNEQEKIRADCKKHLANGGDPAEFIDSVTQEFNNRSSARSKQWAAQQKAEGKDQSLPIY